MMMLICSDDTRKAVRRCLRCSINTSGLLLWRWTWKRIRMIIRLMRWLAWVLT
nr:MAG TPA: hypothetical protein [Caudoviricetes sp.]